MITIEELSKVIKSLVISNKHALSIERLQKDFLENEGYSLPKLGFRDTEDLLRNGLKDAVRIYGSGSKAVLLPIVSEKTEHIHRLVNEQRTSKVRRPPKTVRLKRAYTGSQQYGYSNYITRSQGQYIASRTYTNTNSNISFKNSTASKMSTVNNNYENWKNSTNQQTQNGFSRNSYQNNGAIAKSVSCVDTKNKTDFLPVQNAEKPNWVSNDKTENHTSNNNNVKWTRESSNNVIYVPAGFEESCFKQEVRNLLNSSFNSSPKRKNSVKKESLAENNQPHKIIEQDNFKADKTVTDLDSSQEFVNTEKTTRDIQNLSIENKQETLQENVEIELNDNDSLDLSSSDTLVNSSITSAIFPLKQALSKNDSNSDDAVPEYAINKRIFSIDFPEDTVPYGVKIPTFKMPENIQVDSIISIYISEIHNPYRFWFHLAMEENPLDELQHNIELFYSQSNLEGYDMLLEHIQRGQLCVALFNGLWHRAEILEHFSDNKVKVYFLDYGTVYEVTTNELKYLRKEFVQTPAATCRGALAEINPIRLHWSTDATATFLTMSQDRKLHAKIYEIDMENGVYYLSICDTHMDRVININHELIKMKHAIKSHEWAKGKLNGTQRLRHKREDYPTFDMLEAGQYPTYIEIYYMKANGIDYESITDKMIYYPKIVNLKDKKSKIALPCYLLENNPFKDDIEKQLLTESIDS